MASDLSDTPHIRDAHPEYYRIGDCPLCQAERERPAARESKAERYDELRRLAEALVVAGNELKGRHTSGFGCCAKERCPGGIADDAWVEARKNLRAFLNQEPPK